MAFNKIFSWGWLQLFSYGDDDWFPWLEQAVAPAIQLERLWLPEPFNPDVQAWDRAIDDQITKDDDLTIVAHSLGCIAALRFIQRQSLHNVRLILVGGGVRTATT